MSSRIPRHSFEQLAPRVRSVLSARVERLGYLGEFFQCTAIQPDVLAPFMEMTEGLKQALPDALTETGALTVATLMGNRYELHQHERLSRKLGFSDDWIRDVQRVSPDTAQHLAEAERAVQRMIVAMIERRGHAMSEELDAAVDAIGPAQTVAVMFLVGRYVTHALIVNGLGLSPPVASIFEEERA